VRLQAGFAAVRTYPPTNQAAHDAFRVLDCKAQVWRVGMRHSDAQGRPNVMLMLTAGRDKFEQFRLQAATAPPRWCL
jgi:hypothetical protein